MSHKKRKKKSNRWHDGYETLLRFVKREGHAQVPSEHSEDDFSLGMWVRKQRQRRRKHELTGDRVELLNGLPGWTWSPQDDKWQNGFRRLLAFVRREGHALVEKDHREEGFRLGQWVKSQRLRRETLSRERVELLEQVPGWTWRAVTSWDAKFAALERFSKEHGHCRIPQGYRRDGVDLFSWVNLQKHLYSKGDLSPDRAMQLESLSGWMWRSRPLRQFLTMDEVECADAIWDALFGLGPVPEEKIVSLVAERLRDSGRADFHRLAHTSPLVVRIQESLQTAFRTGYLDAPKDQLIRAVLNNPRDYQPSDWDMCLRRVVPETPVFREEAVEQALLWARENLGLRKDDVQEVKDARKELETAITRALLRGELERAGTDRVRRSFD